MSSSPEKMTSLPTLDDILVPLEVENVRLFEMRYKKSDPPKTQDEFNYAWALIRSKSSEDNHRGVSLLNKIFRDWPERRRECLWYLALGHFKIGDYNTTRRYVEVFLSREPDNQQAIRLSKELEQKVEKEGMIGMALVAGAVSVVGLAATMLVRSNRR